MAPAATAWLKGGLCSPTGSSFLARPLPSTGKRGAIPQVCLPGTAKGTVIYFSQACHENVSTESQVILEGEENWVGEESQRSTVRAEGQRAAQQAGVT